MPHSRQPITKYDVAEVGKHAFYKTFTPSHNVKDFELIGIYPVNENAFEWKIL